MNADENQNNNLTVNNGFWDRPPEERADIMDRDCEQGGVSSFWDMTPEERGRSYDRD